MTQISGNHISDALYERVRQYFGDKELVDLTMAVIASMGGIGSLSRSSRYLEPINLGSERWAKKWNFVAGLECYRRSHEIPLADLDAAMAQDVVGSSGVEIEIRQTEI